METVFHIEHSPPMISRLFGNRVFDQLWKRVILRVEISVIEHHRAPLLRARIVAELIRLPTAGWAVVPSGIPMFPPDTTWKDGQRERGFFCVFIFLFGRIYKFPCFFVIVVFWLYFFAGVCRVSPCPNNVGGAFQRRFPPTPPAGKAYCQTFCIHTAARLDILLRHNGQSQPLGFRNSHFDVGIHSCNTKESCLVTNAGLQPAAGVRLPSPGPAPLPTCRRPPRETVWAQNQLTCQRSEVVWIVWAPSSQQP